MSERGTSDTVMASDGRVAELAVRITEYMLRACVLGEGPCRVYTSCPDVSVKLGSYEAAVNVEKCTYRLEVTCVCCQSATFTTNGLLIYICQEKDVIKRLQNELHNSCLSACVCLDESGLQTTYWVWHTCDPLNNWSLQSEDVPGCDSSYPFVKVFLYMLLSPSACHAVEKSLVQFLNRILLLNPWLSTHCEAHGKIVHRSSIPITYSTSWTKRLRMYYSEHCSSNDLVRVGRLPPQRLEMPACSEHVNMITLYARTSKISTGTINHLHISVRDSDGMPVRMNIEEWCSLVFIPLPPEVTVGVGSAECSSGSPVPDVCYPVLRGPTSACYLLVLVLESNLPLCTNTDMFHLFVKHNHITIQNSLSMALTLMIKMAKVDETGERVSSAVAATLRSMMRLSTNPDFKQKCCHLLQTDSTAEAEVKFREKLFSITQRGKTKEHSTVPCESWQRDTSRASTQQAQSSLSLGVWSEDVQTRNSNETAVHSLSQSQLEYRDTAAASAQNAPSRTEYFGDSRMGVASVNVEGGAQARAEVANRTGRELLEQGCGSGNGHWMASGGSQLSCILTQADGCQQTLGVGGKDEGETDCQPTDQDGLHSELKQKTVSGYTGSSLQPQQASTQDRLYAEMDDDEFLDWDEPSTSMPTVIEPIQSTSQTTWEDNTTKMQHRNLDDEFAEDEKFLDWDS